ncbi:MAG: TIM barrel protein [Planctomycetaceae bacterium]
MTDSIPPGEINSIDYRTHEYNTPQQNNDENWINRLSICQLPGCFWTLENEFQFLKQANISAVGLYRPRFAESGDQHGLNLLRQSQVQVSSIAWAGGFTGSHGFSFEEAVADSCDAVELAYKAGASSVLIATGSRYGHTRKHTSRLIVEGLKRVSDFAAKRKVELAIVPMNQEWGGRWTCLSSIDQAMEVVLHCNCPNLGLGIDFSLLDGTESFSNTIEGVAPHTKLVRLQSLDAETNSDLLTLDEREELSIPQEEIINLFLQHDYEGYFEFDLSLKQSDYEGNQDKLMKLYLQQLLNCRDLFAQSVLI